MRKRTKYNKVPLVVAIQLMNRIYTPILNFYKEMVKNQRFGECTMCKKYTLDSFNACMKQDRQFFIFKEYSYTLDTVSDNVIYLLDKYHQKFGERLWLALAKIFECTRNDMYRIEYK